MLSRVRQLLQAVEAQKSRRAFDRVHGAEDFSQQSGIIRPRLELSQAPFHPVQPFLALRNKFFRQVVHTSYIGRATLTISATRTCYHPIAPGSLTHIMSPN